MYDQVRQLARRRQVSINQLVQESLEAMTREALEEEMQAAYEALAGHGELADVEVFVSAQYEAIARE
jgi:hypothetical protein